MDMDVIGSDTHLLTYLGQVRLDWVGSGQLSLAICNVLCVVCGGWCVSMRCGTDTDTNTKMYTAQHSTARHDTITGHRNTTRYT